jgi:hypothetical protein
MALECGAFDLIKRKRVQNGFYKTGINLSLRPNFFQHGYV